MPPAARRAGRRSAREPWPALGRRRCRTGRMMGGATVLMGENLVWNSQVRVGSHHYARLFLNAGDKVFWLSLPWNLLHLCKGLNYERIAEWNWGRPTVPAKDLLVYCPLTFLPYRNNWPVRSNVF